MSPTSATTFWGSCLSCCPSFLLLTQSIASGCHKPQTHWGCLSQGFPGGKVVKNPPANAGDTKDAGSIPGSGRSPAVVNSNPFQYSCLENSMNRGGWWATVHGGGKESDMTEWLNMPIPAWTLGQQLRMMTRTGGEEASRTFWNILAVPLCNDSHTVYLVII